MTRARDRAHGSIYSAEHPSAASLDAARGRPREGEFPLPQADQAQLSAMNLIHDAIRLRPKQVDHHADRATLGSMTPHLFSPMVR